MTSLDAWAGLALPAAGGLLLLLAAGLGPGRRHARVTREGGTAFLGESLMHRGYAGIDGLARAALRLGWGANTVSWLSLLLGLAAGFGLAGGRFGLAAWLLALSGLGDGMDGAMARLQGTASRRGAVLDSALDRYVEFFCFAGLGWFFRESAALQLLVLAALFGSFMVTYSTAKAEALQVAPPRGWMKRAERMVWLTGGAAVAAALPLAGYSGRPVLVAVLAIIALFANLSAIIRLRALGRAV
jgi:CDP-diacylglycerol--glycerol-3-phosphate 3-phosphatidyltransferase